MLRRKALRLEADLLRQGRLKCADDIFFLYGDEVELLAAGRLGWADVEDRIRERRIDHVRLSKMGPPKTIGLTYPEAASAQEGEGTVLQGQAVQMAVGQGFVQADPLQMAVAYAGIATNYKVKPHLGLRIDDNQGRALQEFATPSRTPLGIPADFRQTIMDGLYGAANDPKGTSHDVFKDFPIKVCGKTGTAQRIGKPDQSWYVVLAPCPNPRYVVAVTDEQGGLPDPLTRAVVPR